MVTELPKDFIEKIYFKALNQRLRHQDLIGVTKIISTVFDDFISISQKTDITKYFETMKTQESENNNNLEKDEQRQEMYFKDARGYCWSCTKIKCIQELKNKLEKYEPKT